MRGEKKSERKTVEWREESEGKKERDLIKRFSFVIEYMSSTTKILTLRSHKQESKKN